MPQIAVRSVANSIERFKIRINRIPEFRNTNEIVHFEFRRFVFVQIQAKRFSVFNFENGIAIADFSAFQRHLRAFFDRDIIQCSTLRQMFLENETELFLFFKFSHFGSNLFSKFRIIDLIYKIMN